jgi:hypothetical protein
MKTTALSMMLLCVVGCSSKDAWTPLSAKISTGPDTTLVWVGRGQCERYEDGAWVRHPELDYEFSVEQHRLDNRWESIKTMRWLHPDYDGSAGPRLQNYFFQIEYGQPDAQGNAKSTIKSSLGGGSGSTDQEFRASTLNIRAEVSRFAPFDQYKITQSYLYEEGLLKETVELNKGGQPWVRNQEIASLFAKHRFEAAPTKL